MSSSPSSGPVSTPAVEAFEYQDAVAADPTAQENTATPVSKSSGNRPLSADLEQKLALVRAEGVREGLQQARQNFETLMAQERAKVAEAIAAFERQASEYYSRVETELVQLSLAIAAKILHREAQVDRLLVAGLVKVALDKFHQGTSVTVRVHPSEVPEWTRYFQESLAGRIRVEVKGDPAIQPKHCVLETELGQTELGLEAQLKEVEQGFFDLLAQRPDTK